MPGHTEDMFAQAPSEETRELLARQHTQERTSIHEARRRPLGLDPEAALAGLSAVTLVVAVVLFAVGAWLAGLIVLVLAGASAALFACAVRHEPTTRLARVTRRLLTRGSGFIRFGLTTGRTWGSAITSLIGIRLRRQRLRHELQRQLAPLGEAVYRDEQWRAERLKAHAAQLEQAIREADRQAAALMEGARAEVRQERATAQPTQALPTLRG